MKTILFASRSCIVIAMLIFSSCSELREEEVLSTAPKTGPEKYIPELAYPGITGIEKKGKLFGEEITYHQINGEAVFEGDIILSKEQLNEEAGLRTQAAGVPSKAQRWTNGIVPYTIDKSLTNASDIYKAMIHIEYYTPIRFVQRSNQNNYVTFKNSHGFSSSIGMSGGQQFVNLGLAFNYGGVLHEICHTLGLFHEHNRDDRDQTITVHYGYPGCRLTQGLLYRSKRSLRQRS